MAIVDTNTVIRTYLVACTSLTDLIGTKVYVPRLHENAILPAISFKTVGGDTNPHIPPWLRPSVQFFCWADSFMGARAVYRALYDNLQGIERQVVAVGGTDYIIWSAEEESQGQDLVDEEIPEYFKVLTFFTFDIKAE